MRETIEIPTIPIHDAVRGDEYRVLYVTDPVTGHVIIIKTCTIIEDDDGSGEIHFQSYEICEDYREFISKSVRIEAEMREMSVSEMLANPQAVDAINFAHDIANKIDSLNGDDPRLTHNENN